MYLITILVYLVIIVAIGILFKNQNRNIEDFALAGRKLNTPVLVGTLFASYIGGATVVGWTGSFYQMGIDWWFSGVGALLGILAASTIMAEKCRRLQQYTVPDMLALRYSQSTRYVSAVMIIIGDIAIVTVQILAMTGILVSFTGIERMTAMIVSVLSFTLISLFGGMKGVAVTDSIQAVLIFLGLLIGVTVAFQIGGGIVPVFTSLPENYFQPFTDVSLIGALGMAIASFGITAVSQALIFSRVFSAKDSQTAKKGLYWLIPTAFCGYLFVALLGYSGRAVLGPDVPPGEVFSTLVTTTMPPFMGGLLLAVIIAAIVTSTNFILLSASVNFTRDFYQQLAKENVSGTRLMKVGQLAVAIFALLSFSLAVVMPDIVTAIVFAYTMYSASLLVPLYAGYLWKGATAAAGTLSVIGGGGTALVWYLLKEPFNLPSMIPAIIVSLSLIIIVSLLTKKTPAEQFEKLGM
ncbi:sodium:solute symporter family protein [Caldalkalibacillus thermarum]|uniref:sodium:solute symporter family protein n=1 Tax=Caldalkalibacillus thermarum TaxID=296745 RepID=UPI00166E2759|nr:sodium:solute symporter family protein [Caldalkalibacillus thermarum]GGK29277.1 sodium:solute symporter family protein [Caldalkalibacillus thermarum]